MRRQLSEKTDYLLNFDRIGNLFFSNYRYSARELIDRGFIVSIMAAGGFLTHNNNEKAGIGSIALGVSLGFVLAHALVISPLIYKKLKFKWGCDELIKSINVQLNTNENEDFCFLIKEVINEIMDHADINTSPSAVWGKRHRLLTTLDRWLREEEPATLVKNLIAADRVAYLDHNRVNPELLMN